MKKQKCTELEENDEEVKPLGETQTIEESPPHLPFKILFILLLIKIRSCPSRSQHDSG